MGELARELGTVVGGVNTLELGRASGLPRSTFRESICQWCLAQWFKKFLFCFVSLLYLWQGSKIRGLAGLDKTFFFSIPLRISIFVGSLHCTGPSWTIVQPGRAFMS